MMKWRHTLIAGGAIILLTNAVALGGAAYNRSGEPESQLQLTQREFNRFYSYSRKDNSGITLSLNWRLEPVELNEYGFGRYSGHWGMPAWLDEAKMTELGFDVDKFVATKYGRRHWEFQPREVLLVLELDGPVYQRHVQRVREYVEETREQLAASPASKEMQGRAKRVEEKYKQEQEESSRLFVIDAGLDLAALRATYPDHARYAIVHGLIRPTTMTIKKETRVGGSVTELHGGFVNVPLRYRQVFSDQAPYDVTLAFGKRLEPWIVAASRGAATK